MREPFRSRGFPDYEMDWYGAPGGEYVAGSKGPDRQYPGSDPALVGEELFTEARRRRRDPAPDDPGIMPDRHLGTAIASAHNEMMVNRWLEHAEFGDQLPRHHPGQPGRHRRRTARDRQVQGPPAGRAARHPAAVPRAVRQAAVLAAVGGRRRGEAPRGRAHRGRVGGRLPPTPSGNTRTYEQYLSFMSLNYLYHLMNMIAEGVFERMPELKFVWADGAADLLDAVHLADGLLRPTAPRADAVGAEDAQRLPAGPRLLRAGQPRRPRRCRLRRRVGRLHRQGRHDDVRLELSRTGTAASCWCPSSYSVEQRDKLCWRNAAELYGIDIPAIRPRRHSRG